MNLKKYLQESAEKDAEALITESDRLFIEQLIEKYVQSDSQEKAETQSSKKNRRCIR